MQLPNATGPTAVTTFDADSPSDRAMLLGGFDGYIRSFSNSIATDDNGSSAATAVSSRVVLMPDIPVGSLGELFVNGVRVELEATSASCSVKAFRGRTKQDAITKAIASPAVPVWSKTIHKGRSAEVVRSVSGNSIVFTLTSTGRWAMENFEITADVPAINRRHKEGNGT
jgi:hypothetical protein